MTCLAKNPSPVTTRLSPEKDREKERKRRGKGGRESQRRVGGINKGKPRSTEQGEGSKGKMVGRNTQRKRRGGRDKDTPKGETQMKRTTEPGGSACREASRRHRQASEEGEQNCRTVALNDNRDQRRLQRYTYLMAPAAASPG